MLIIDAHPYDSLISWGTTGFGKLRVPLGYCWATPAFHITKVQSTCSYLMGLPPPPGTSMGEYSAPGLLGYGN